MGRYFEHLSEEEEKKITAALWAKYGPMTLSEMDTDLRGIGFKPRYVDPQPIDIRESKNYLKDRTKLEMLNDEAGHWDTSKIEKHWKVGLTTEPPNCKLEVASKGIGGQTPQNKLNITKSKTMSNEGKNTVQETEASALLNRLCHIDDVAHGNKNCSKDVKIRLFGLEPEDDLDPPLEPKSESWFALVNAKLNSIQDALRETGNNLDRINCGTQF